MTDEEMLREVHQAVLGIKGTDDRGILGDMKKVRETIESVCADQNKLKGTVHNLIWFLAGTGLLAGGTLIKLLVG